MPPRPPLASLAATFLVLCASCAPLPSFRATHQVPATPSVVPLVLVPQAPLHPFVHATANGRQGLFVVDTGATVTCLHARFARSLGLAQQQPPKWLFRTNVTGELKLACLDTFTIGHHCYTSLPVAVLQLGHLEQILGRPIDGVIGMNVLREQRFAIDFPDGRFTLGHPGSAATPVRLAANPNELFLEAALDHTKVRLKIDTGAGATQLSSRDFGRVARAGAPTRSVRLPRIADVNGVSHNPLVRELRADLRAGPVHRRGLIVREGDVNLLGMDFLHSRPVVFDPGRGTMQIHPDSGMDKR